MPEEFSDQPPGTAVQSCPLRAITIYLYDPAGDPVQDERVQLVREGEEPVDATTDDEGKAYVEDLTPGKWEVVFPDRAFDEWRRVEAPEKPATWLDLGLIDHAGNPVGNEPYEVIAPDGETVHQGRLGPDGKARVEVGAPGLCKVNFPERNASDWFPVAGKSEEEPDA